MARISTYAADTDVSGSDKVLGTDTSGATKNYLLDSVGEYYTKNNVITVAGQLSFVYRASSSANSEFFVNDGVGGIPEMEGITKINISTKYADGSSLEQMLNEVIADKFMIVEARNQNVKAIFTTSSYGVNPSNSDYKDIEVTVSNATGGLEADKVYLLSKYSSGEDKNYTHVQSNASTTWTVAHNLGKKPSVTIVDSADSVVIGQISYTNNNNLTITLSSPTSGKAYIN